MRHFLFTLIIQTAVILIESHYNLINIYNSNDTEIFEKFLKVTKVQYDDTEKVFRAGIFKTTLNYIRKHNKKKYETFHLGLNHFSDKTDIEIKRVLGFKGLMEGRARFKQYPKPREDGQFIDLRKTGCIGKVQDQGQCGSCYAIATVENVDSVNCLKCKNSILLSSPQNIIDCSKDQGNFGCDGGWMETVVKYIANAPGINLLKDYPYTAKEGKCAFNNQTAIYKNVIGHTEVEADENKMMDIINILRTPLYVAVKVNRQFSMYRGGVYGSVGICKSRPSELNHAVQIVGYGTDTSSKKMFWLVKNSWGESWGENGYIRILRSGCCLGICQAVGYVNLKCNQNVL